MARQVGRSAGTAYGGLVERATFFVHGLVQGVGFRWWARSRALELGLAGHARNTSDGRVEVVAQGEREVILRLETLLRESPSTTGRPGCVERVVATWGSPRDGTEGFATR